MAEHRFELIDPLPGVDRVVVYGLGWTGVAAANLLRRIGKEVVATDTRDTKRLDEALARLHQEEGIALDPGVTVQLGGHTPHGAQAVVLTQSLKHHDPAVLAARAAGLPAVPEIELAASAFDRAQVALVTIGGTDGKTTTTRLVGHIAVAQRRSVVGGNSWPPLSATVPAFLDALAADPPDATPILVAEVSAFQLPPWHNLRPRGAVVTNIAEDHVDEFFAGSMDAYVAAKRALTDRLGPGDWAALNADDRRVGTWGDAIAARGARVFLTSLTSRAVYGARDAAFRSNGELRLRRDGVETGLMEQGDVPLVGDHNIENVLCAAALIAPLDLDLDGVRASIRSFEPPHHRLEWVRALDGGVDVYDDSKATNAHASLAGLAAFGRRSLVVIVGGVDKGLDLDPWVEALRARARRVIAIGELRRRLADQYGARLPQLSAASSMEEAVDLALSAACPGDVVVLSPACSSFDMFRSYDHRGQVFQEAVRSWRPKSDAQR